jgi:glycosyltransferase involved in cell wall biosynthesis
VYGGPIFSTLHTCQALAKLDGVEIYVSTTNSNMTSKLNVEVNKWQKFEDGFFVKYYNETVVEKFSLQLYLNVWKDIKKPDIVHVQSIFSTSTLVALYYVQLFKKPILLSPRGQFGSWCLENGSGFKQQWLNWFVRPFANKVLWHATANQEKIEILEVFPNAKIKIISNGIEFDLFQKSKLLSKKEFIKKFAEKEVDLDKIIVSMGRLQKKKGFDILIDSFVKALNKYPIAKLFIAGQDEGEKANLAQQINKLELENKVFLIGSISGQDKIDFLANADLFVLPSHNENFGNVYVESLAAGTPIVASKNTPWEEIEEADCGMWVENKINETAEAIEEMLKKDRETMRVNSRRFAEKYDWKNIAAQFKEVFEEMLGE